jgi:hypothetical protein
VFGKDRHKNNPHPAFSTQLYTKPQQSADFYGPRWKKAHTRPTFAPDRKTDWNVGFENAPSLPECLALCNLKLGCLGQHTAVCQIHAAQLLTALCPPIAQQTSCLLCGNIYQIDGI